MLTDVLGLLVCPACFEGELLGLDASPIDGAVTCSHCGAVYPVRRSIPILLVSDGESPVERARAAAKQKQASYYEHETDSQFEIERPAQSPEAYRWLLNQKMERAVQGLPPLAGATVVNPCCGSGMEAEFLAAKGAHVLAIDFSEACALRARERAQRHGSDYVVVVADAERLPVRTNSADVAYVHDGLHHLEDPLIGLRELSRVARQAVSITEPADAFLTRIAVRLGVATDLEEAGNRVGRLRSTEIRRTLVEAGLASSESRYLMYYRHEPGALMALFSRPVFFPIYRIGFTAANLALGRWGNKLCVVGSRNQTNVSEAAFCSG